jgi:hypothetical protein
MERLSHDPEVVKDICPTSIKWSLVVDDPAFWELTGGSHELTIEGRELSYCFCCLGIF